MSKDTEEDRPGDPQEDSTERIEPKEHVMRVADASVVRQVIENKGHRLDVIREALSNACAREVQATLVEVKKYYDPDYGVSFIISDDGCGMAYSGEEDWRKQKRIDKFLNLGYSRIMGLDGDEFSYKGLGAKLMFHCRRLEIETWDGRSDVHYVLIDEPFKALTQVPPRLPKPLIYPRKPTEGDKRGTKIKIMGYEGGKEQHDYRLQNFEEYLRYKSIVGCTRERDLPRVVLQVDDERKELSCGYDWIQPRESEDGSLNPRTVLMIPITKRSTRRTETGEVEVETTLKGGYTLDTGREATGKLYPMTQQRRSVGLKLSMQAIPYCGLDFYAFRSTFDLPRALCDFVIECDQISMDMSRSHPVEDSVYDTMKKLVRESFQELAASQEYDELKKIGRREKLAELGRILNERKDALGKPEQQWVYVDGRRIHRAPTCENDTLAVLWKMEGMGKLPFLHFISHAHTEQKGIDILADLQEDIECEKQKLVAVEVEHEFEGFKEHRHSPKQTSAVICWSIRKPDRLLKDDDHGFKYYAKFNGKTIAIYVLSQMPDVEIDTMRYK